MHADIAQDCAPVPENTTFVIDTLFPADKSYYGYRSVPFACLPAYQAAVR